VVVVVVVTPLIKKSFFFAQSSFSLFFFLPSFSSDQTDDDYKATMKKNSSSLSLSSSSKTAPSSLDHEFELLRQMQAEIKASEKEKNKKNAEEVAKKRIDEFRRSIGITSSNYNPQHRCNGLCMEPRNHATSADRNLFLCIRSGQIHDCEQSSTHPLVVVEEDTHYICWMSGRVLEPVIHNITISKEPDRGGGSGIKVKGRKQHQRGEVLANEHGDYYRQMDAAAASIATNTTYPNNNNNNNSAAETLPASSAATFDDDDDCYHQEEDRMFRNYHHQRKKALMLNNSKNKKSVLSSSSAATPSSFGAATATTTITRRPRGRPPLLSKSMSCSSKIQINVPKTKPVSSLMSKRNKKRNFSDYGDDDNEHEDSDDSDDSDNTNDSDNEDDSDDFANTSVSNCYYDNYDDDDDDDDDNDINRNGYSLVDDHNDNNANHIKPILLDHGANNAAVEEEEEEQEKEREREEKEKEEKKHVYSSSSALLLCIDSVAVGEKKREEKKTDKNIISNDDHHDDIFQKNINTTDDFSSSSSSSSSSKQPVIIFPNASSSNNPQVYSISALKEKLTIRVTGVLEKLTSLSCQDQVWELQKKTITSRCRALVQQEIRVSSGSKKGRLPPAREREIYNLVAAEFVRKKSLVTANEIAEATHVIVGFWIKLIPYYERLNTSAQNFNQVSLQFALGMLSLMQKSWSIDNIQVIRKMSWLDNVPCVSQMLKASNLAKHGLITNGESDLKRVLTTVQQKDFTMSDFLKEIYPDAFTFV
jgi:hypothetical protein